MCSTCGCKGAEDSDISKNIFGNMRDAKKRAKQLGTKQIHSHDLNGDKVFMPFKTHQEYQKNMGAESFGAEEYLPLGKDNWDLYELDDGSKNIKIADKITTKFNQEMHKTIKMVKEGSNPDKEAQKLFDKMEKFMDKYEDEGATDSEPIEVLSETINQVFEKHGYSPEYYIAESFGAESNFDKLANKIAAQYRKKGKSAKEAMRIGKATAAKIGFKKYGKAGMRRKAMRGRMAKGAEGSMPKKSIIPNVIIFGVLGVTAYLATKIKSVEFGADGGCGCGCKGAKVGGCGDTKQADEGHYPETFDPVQDWLPRYRYPADSDWSNSYNPADPYRPLDYQTVQIDSRTTVDKMGMI